MISAKCGLRLLVVLLLFAMASVVAAQDYRGKAVVAYGHTPVPEAVS